MSELQTTACLSAKGSWKYEQLFGMVISKTLGMRMPFAGEADAKRMS